MKKKDREIFRRLQEAHPDARCELDHETPFQLLVSTVLSAQATDVQEPDEFVNTINTLKNDKETP